MKTKILADFQFCMSVTLTCAEFGVHKFFVLFLHFLITWGHKILENVFEKCDFLKWYICFLFMINAGV